MTYFCVERDVKLQLDQSVSEQASVGRLV